MRLAEKPVPRSYHLQDYDWTPLSRNPSWLSSVVHQYCAYMTRIRISPAAMKSSKLVKLWIWIEIYSARLMNLSQTTYLNPGIVSAESSPCATIHWGSSRVFWFVLSYLMPHKLELECVGTFACVWYFWKLLTFRMCSCMCLILLHVFAFHNWGKILL